MHVAAVVAKSKRAVLRLGEDHADASHAVGSRQFTVPRNPTPTHTPASKKPSEVWEQVYRHTEAWSLHANFRPFRIAGL